MRMVVFNIIIFCLLCQLHLIAQVRVVQSVNTNWQFHKGDSSVQAINSGQNVSWSKVSLPHTWNIEDVSDDAPGYYRGPAWYRKNISIPLQWKDKEVYLYFEGANQVAVLYVNGQLAGKHIGGYTAFSFPVSKYLKYGKGIANEIIVRMDNSHSEDIPPLAADFTFYGGIYRDVFLIAANKIHFDMDDYGSSGIRIKTPSVSRDKATVLVEGAVSIKSSQMRSLKVVSQIIDKRDRTVGIAVQKIRAGSADRIGFKQSCIIKNPNLWSPDTPYLYRVITQIVDIATGDVLDEISNPLGFRWFRFDANKGFFLNGQHLKLVGANRHQDFKGIGNALPDALQERDMRLLKDMGANFVRLSHYPQDPSLLEACDRLGIMASVEVPVQNRISESLAFANNCRSMQIEMIRQNFNHPSVIIWAYMNEIMLQTNFENDSLRRATYFSEVVKLAKEIEQLTRREDASRYTMIPCHGNYDLYTSSGLTKIPQIIGWNVYNGWYSSGLGGSGRFLDYCHLNTPDKPIIVSEFGADADYRSHSLNPERFDKSVEYQVIYHSHYIKEIMKRPFIAGAAVWNLTDFNSERRVESTPHMNAKGLFTNQREPKEAYFLYQAYLNKTPYVKMGGNQWLLRSGIADSSFTCNQPLTVFSNQPEVQLWIDGKFFGTEKVNDCKAVFNVPFKNGKNQLKVLVPGTLLEDMAEVEFRMLPYRLDDNSIPFEELNISLGDKRFFIDDELQQVWMPEQPYKKGSWGYIGGEIYAMRNTKRLSFGSDKDIYGTTYDPIFATQRIGIKSFKADVPDGKYKVSCHFSELEAQGNSETLANNLDEGITRQQDGASRSFDVLLNGQIIINGLSNNNYLEPQIAYTLTSVINVKDGKGITVDFNPLKGQPILNAVQIKKVF